MSNIVNLDPASLVTITPVVKAADPAAPGTQIVVNKGNPMEITLAQLAAWIKVVNT